MSEVLQTLPQLPPINAFIPPEIFFMILGLIVGFFVGYYFLFLTVGPSIRDLIRARRKRLPLLLHLGRDNVFRFYIARRDDAGVWHTPFLKVFPDPSSVRPLAGISHMAIAHSGTVTTLSPEFLTFVEDMTKTFIKENKRPPELADIIERLTARKEEVRKMLDWLDKIKRGEITKEAVVAAWKGENISNEEYREALLQLDSLIQTEGKSLREELARLEAASKFSIEEDGWRIDWRFDPEKKKKIPYLVREKVVTFQNFLDLLPKGGEVEDVWTLVQRAEAAALKEATNVQPGQIVKWVAMGIFFFLILLGVYIVLHYVLK